MRKCVITNQVKVDRTDEQLLSLWTEEIRKYNEGVLPGMNLNINPNMDSSERRKFFYQNRSYWEPRHVLGLFHQWGLESVDEENGMHEYTVAIVELDDGTIVTPLPTVVSFLPPDAERTAYEKFARMGHHNLGRGFDVG